MKLKSLLLGSAAVMALSAGAQAADPMTEFVSLGVCDAYGITGITIESDDTCLKISGSVTYGFQYGDYRDGVAGGWLTPAAGNRNIDDNNGLNDWRSRLETILSFEATTQTDAGAAKAFISFRERDYVDGINNVTVDPGADDHPLRIQDAYVSFGDTTVLMAGKKGSIAMTGNDEPFNYLGLVNSQSVDHGVSWSYDDGSPGQPNSLRTGGHVIQVVSEVADGISVGAALESLDGTAANSRGSFVAFVAATGAWGEADATLVVGDILDNAGGANPWGFRASAMAEFDAFKVRGAFAVDDTEYWNALISGEAGFDLFTIAASAEFINTGTSGISGYAANTNQFGAGASVGFQATDTVAINAGFRYFDEDTSVGGASDGWQAALQVVADVTDTIEVSGAVGAYGGGNIPAGNDPLAYVDLGVAYNPGGGFTTGAGIEANALGAYKLKFDAKKTF